MASRAGHARGIDVLNTSVTELMLLAIFFILLALAIARSDLADASKSNVDLRSLIEEQAAEIAALKRRLSDLRESIGISTDLEAQLNQRLVRIDELEQENRDLRQALAENRIANQAMEERIRELDEQLNAIRRALGVERIADDTVDELAKAISDLKRVAAANNIDPDAPLDQLISRLESELGARAGAVETMRQKMKKAGLSDKAIAEIDGTVITPSCWRNDQGRADALFDIYIRATGYRVVAAWPKIREADANSSRWIREMAKTGTLSVAEFRRLGRNIRAESEKRQPPCIFVANVRIDDTRVPDAAQFKRLRDVAGLFFYIR